MAEKRIARLLLVFSPQRPRVDYGRSSEVEIGQLAHGTNITHSERAVTDRHDGNWRKI